MCNQSGQAREFCFRCEKDFEYPCLSMFRARVDVVGQRRGEFSQLASYLVLALGITSAGLPTPSKAIERPQLCTAWADEPPPVTEPAVERMGIHGAANFCLTLSLLLPLPLLMLAPPTFVP